MNANLLQSIGLKQPKIRDIPKKSANSFNRSQLTNDPENMLNGPYFIRPLRKQPA